MRLGLFLDSAVIEIELHFEERIRILLKKIDTWTGFSGSDCTPAASLSDILNDGLSMPSILVKMDLVCKELHGTLGNYKALISQRSFDIFEIDCAIELNVIAAVI